MLFDESRACVEGCYGEGGCGVSWGSVDESWGYVAFEVRSRLEAIASMRSYNYRFAYG